MKFMRFRGATTSAKSLKQAKKNEPKGVAINSKSVKGKKTLIHENLKNYSNGSSRIWVYGREDMNPINLKKVNHEAKRNEVIRLQECLDKKTLLDHELQSILNYMVKVERYMVETCPKYATPKERKLHIIRMSLYALNKLFRGKAIRELNEKYNIKGNVNTKPLSEKLINAINS